MKSFRNADNVLTAWGYVESNGADISRDEPDSFSLEPGKWRLVDGAWEIVVTQPPPVPAKVMTSLAFIELFTPAEQLSIVTAAMQSPELRLWYDKLMAADQVVFDDPRLLEGMGVIVSAGLITQARHDEILSTK